MAFVRNVLKTRSKITVSLLARGAAVAFPDPLPAPTSPPLSAPLSSSPAPLPSSSSSSFDVHLVPAHTRFFSPLSRLTPFSTAEPLFLSSPAWKLPQSATQLRLLGDEARGAGDCHADKGSTVPFVDKKEDEVRQKESGGGPSGNAGSQFQEDGVLNLPNMISISRMVSGPLIAWMIHNNLYSYSFLALTLAGITDWLDGLAARKLKINSVLGSYLDPLADKVLICSVAVAMVEKNLLQSWVVLLVVLRDVLLVGGAFYKRADSLGWQWKSLSHFVNINKTHPERVQPLFISKVNTIFQLILVAAALLQPEFGTNGTEPYIAYLSWLVASTTVASTMAYGLQYIRSRATIRAR